MCTGVGSASTVLLTGGKTLWYFFNNPLRLLPGLSIMFRNSNVYEPIVFLGKRR